MEYWCPSRALALQVSLTSREPLLLRHFQRFVVLELMAASARSGGEVVRAKGLANLCVPRELRHVREIPKLGTGKVNHRALIDSLANP